MLPTTWLALAGCAQAKPSQKSYQNIPALGHLLCTNKSFSHMWPTSTVIQWEALENPEKRKAQIFCLCQKPVPDILSVLMYISNTF